MIRNFAALLIPLSLVFVGCAEPADNYTDKFTTLDPSWVVTADEGYAWASVKNDNLPTLTGSPEWHNYMAFLEEKFTEYGVADTWKNSWEFERWNKDLFTAQAATMTELTGVLMTADLASINPSNDSESFLNTTNRDEQFDEGSLE